MSSAPEPFVDDPAQAAQEIESLRRQLAEERERALHAVDGQRGAEAVAAEAQADVRELTYRLHVREAELGQLQEVLDQLGYRPAAAEPEPASGLRSRPEGSAQYRQSAMTMADRIGRGAKRSLGYLRAAVQERLGGGSA